MKLTDEQIDSIMERVHAFESAVRRFAEQMMAVISNDDAHPVADAAVAPSNELEAFEEWFKTAGIWNHAISGRTWKAACTWMRNAAAKPPHDEPRNVDGLTRAEFEARLRVAFQHDNVRAQECGIGPRWDGPVGLTAEDEREIAERVERNYPLDGTFVCPICGKDAPHEHSGEEIVTYRNAQKQSAHSVEADAVAPGEAVFALQALVAAGHVTQAKVDEALQIARKTSDVAQPDERAECIEWANANGFPKYHDSMVAAWEERARRAASQGAKQ